MLKEISGMSEKYIRVNCLVSVSQVKNHSRNHNHNDHQDYWQYFPKNFSPPYRRTYFPKKWLWHNSPHQRYDQEKFKMIKKETNKKQKTRTYDPDVARYCKIYRDLSQNRPVEWGLSQNRLLPTTYWKPRLIIMMSLRQPPVPPMTTKLASWWLFVFGVFIMAIPIPGNAVLYWNVSLGVWPLAVCWQTSGGTLRLY